MEETTSAKLVLEGQEALLNGEFEKAAWSLDTAMLITPDRSPQMWQRGLCCFYTCRYKEGMEQFQNDMSENGSDIEEVLWHFLCQSKLLGFEESKRKGFLRLSDSSGASPTPPMPEVLQLFKSHGTVADVIEAATGSGEQVVASYNGTNALAYAHFYIGLYFEIQGILDKAKHHLWLASSYQNPDYMGKLMLMHHKLFMRTVWRRDVPLVTIGSQATSSKGKPYQASAVIVGNWQLSTGHDLVKQPLSNAERISSLLKMVDHGISTFDCGDIYTGVEEILGSLIRVHLAKGGSREDIRIHTKCVPDMAEIKSGKVDQDYVRGLIRRSLNRLGTTYLDLVQFTWWNTSYEGLLDAVQSLSQLQREGLVKQIGVTNFDTNTMAQVLSTGVAIATTQVQFSVLDNRPSKTGLTDLCLQNGMSILAYGVLAGGFLTDKWLGATPPLQLANRSLVKYQLIIEDFGGWPLYQQLLRVLRRIADRHSSVLASRGEGDSNVSIAMVAVAYVFSQPGVGGIIVGSTNQSHIEEAIRACKLKLTVVDYQEIQEVLQQSVGPKGAVYGIERSEEKHSSIMKYNLNQLNRANHLEELTHRFIKLLFRGCPSEATSKGYRDTNPFALLFDDNHDFSFECHNLYVLRECSYDHALAISASEDIEHHCEQIETMLSEASCISTAVLSPDQSVDHQLIISQLKLELVRWKEMRMHEKDPAFYLHFEAVNYLLPTWGSDNQTSGTRMHSLAQLTHPGVTQLSVSLRLLALLSRLRAIPGQIRNAHHNLISPVLTYVERAIELCKSLEHFLTQDIHRLVNIMVTSEEGKQEKGIGTLVKEVGDAATVAAVCIAQYKVFLEEKLLPKAGKLTGVGREVYDKLLQYQHFGVDSEQLLAIGEEHFAKVKSQLEQLASDIDPTSDWQAITEEVIRPLHPTAAELLSSYMEEIERSQSFFLSNDCFPSLPKGEKVVGFYTPPFLIPFSPFGDFLNPIPFPTGADRKENETSHEESGREQTGFLMLHSIEGMNLSPTEKNKLLRHHDFTWISVIAPHECYPGHHVQSILAQQHPRDLRRLYSSVIFYEGWGLYSENLAYELGFFKKAVLREKEGKVVKMSATEYEKLSRLTQLRLQLWRAARVILDVKLNTGELSFAQCQEYLQEEVMFNHHSTAGEVFMYLSRPTYATCYITGYLQLMQLREELKKRCLDNKVSFCLKDFHKLVLNHGCLPFELLTKLIFT